MPRPPLLREAIKRVIKENGPMTVVEIAEELARSFATVSSCIGDARGTKEKHFYVKSYRPQVGRSGTPAGVYAVGNRKDAPPPKTAKSVIDRRYYEKHHARIKLRRRVRVLDPFASMVNQLGIRTHEIR